MAPAAHAELLQLEPRRIVSAVLLGRVIPPTADGTLERNRQPIGLRLLGHCTTSFAANGSQGPIRPKQSRGGLVYRRGSNLMPCYTSMEVTTPAPTVRPPSRIANRNPSSIATGVINSTPIWMLSPGITISTPSGSEMFPVTSVVRM